MTDLEKIDFGLGAAQQEQHLTNYFYRSGSFKIAGSDKTYLILGAKGAGKSAIFRMLQELREEIEILKPPNLWIADEPQFREHWSMLQAQNITSQITLWRFYVASLIAKLCLEADFIYLGDLGITSNGHMLMLERNSDALAQLNFPNRKLSIVSSDPELPNRTFS